jgi:D-alanyl-D-alanine dipeptidase
MKRLLIGAAAVVAAMAFAIGANAGTTEPVHFTVENTTSSTMTSLHLSTPSSNSWEENILSEEVGGGESVDVTIDDDLEDCNYDMRADFDDGTNIDVRNVNFCELDGQTITISE